MARQLQGEVFLLRTSPLRSCLPSGREDCPPTPAGMAFLQHFHPSKQTLMKVSPHFHLVKPLQYPPKKLAGYTCLIPSFTTSALIFSVGKRQNQSMYSLPPPTPSGSPPPSWALRDYTLSTQARPSSVGQGLASGPSPVSSNFTGWVLCDAG